MIFHCVKKIIIFTIILLFIIHYANYFIRNADAINLNKNNVIISPNYFENILYVGGYGEGNYTNIQDAIDNASDGDCVFVFNGTYYENIIINKAIDLIGENNKTTIIEGRGFANTINISSNHVIVRKFTIRNSGTSQFFSGIFINSSQVLISENNFESTPYGIFISNSSHVTIRENKIIYSKYYPVLLIDSSENIIIDNTIIGGIGLYFVSYQNPNLFLNNQIIHNVITNTDGFGIGCAAGINFLISNNIINECGSCGIRVTNCINTIIKKNIVSNITGGFFRIGIFIDGSNRSIVLNNILIKNFNGIFLNGDDCLIVENTNINNSNIDLSVQFNRRNNRIYHNNFLFWPIDDGENNIWDDNISMGNYWRYYQGNDHNGDGIGDTPVDILGVDNVQDRYPLIFPYEDKPNSKITTPEKNYIYFRNIKIISFFITIIFSTIKIQVSAANYVHGIFRVEFYIDNILRKIDFTPPYNWIWRINSHIVHKHTIKIITFDNCGKYEKNELIVWKFF